MADLASGVSERERDQGGQAERRADLLHGGLHPGGQARVPSCDLMERAVDSAGVVLSVDGQPVTLMSFTVAARKIVYAAGIADPGRVRRIAAAALTDG